MGDFNGDGAPDLAFTNEVDNTVSVVLGNGGGGFTPAPGSPFGVGATPRSIAVGDFNGDGAPDLAVANVNHSTVSVLLGNGAGGFTPAAGSPVNVGVNPAFVAVGYFNGDGAADLAVANASDNTVSVLLGNGSGGFTPAPGSPVGGVVEPFSIAVSDFNGDGVPDLAVANNGDSSVSVLLGNGSGGFTPAVGSPFAVGYVPRSVVVGDFNGDGVADLAVANYGDDNLSVLLGNGSGGFTPAVGSPFPVGHWPRSVAVGDFNADGVADLAVANLGDSNVSVLLGNGVGGFTPTSGSPFGIGSGPCSVVVTDFNGDGAPDLAVANRDGNTVSMLLNQFTRADLMISLGVDRIDVKQGATLTYTLTVQNFGPNRATNVEVDDTLSTATTFVSAKVNKGQFTAPLVGQSGTVIWSPGNLAASDVQGAQIAVTVIAKARTTITNNALVFSDTDDPKLANNAAAITVNVVSGNGGSNGGKK